MNGNEVVYAKPNPTRDDMLVRMLVQMIAIRIVKSRTLVFRLMPSHVKTWTNQVRMGSAAGTGVARSVTERESSRIQNLFLDVGDESYRRNLWDLLFRPYVYGVSSNSLELSFLTSFAQTPEIRSNIGC